MSTPKEPNQKFVACTKLLGDAWTLLIVDVLANKALRFSEIERTCGICPVTLSDRLKKLEQEQVVKRYSEISGKVSVSYELTPKGRAILPILKMMAQFAKQYEA